MDVRSLSWRTDLFFNRFEGRVEDRGDHLVVETPANPTFHWGNYLLFDGPPRAGDLVRWTARFRDAFAHAPAVRHVSLGWDGIDGAVGEVAPFVDAGFVLDPVVALVATGVAPPPQANDRVQVRPLATDAEWDAALENQILGAGEGFNAEAYRVFKTLKMASWRRMVDAGLGRWFGAFDGETLLADCGVFVDGELGRFQSVVTDAAHRRQGIGGTLVYEAARHALAKLGVRRLVIVADADEAPARLYASLAFREVERSVAVSRAATRRRVGEP